jgi:hypothetical protein
VTKNAYIDNMKICNKCNIEKPLEMFSNIKVKDKVYKQSNCKKCRSEYRNMRRKLNPTLESFRKRKQTLRSKYGIEIEEYDKMYLDQKGCCKICNKEYKLLSVDHCHNTGLVRGLLCKICNTSLGGFKDSIINLTEAIKYLKETNTHK